MPDLWDTVLAQATKSLVVRQAGGGATEQNKFALDRATRVVRTIEALAEKIDAAIRPPRIDLVKIAALYSCVPYAANLGERVDDDGSELAADQLKEKIPALDIDLVLRILREYRSRNTQLPEARLLSDAVALEDIGLVGLWNQTRHFHSAGKTLEQVLRLWKTQQEYGYWETRLREGLYFDPTRHAAERRLAALHTIFDRMSREHNASDI
jgi:hypothetical protein